MTPIAQIIAALGGQAVLLAAIGFLIKSLTAQALARDIEKFKADLQIEAHRRTTVFSRLHEKRAETIAEIYKLLVEAELAVRSMVAPMQTIAEADADTKMAASAAAIEKFRDKFEASRIWFKPATCEKTDAVLTELRSIHNFFNIVVRGRARGKDSDGDPKHWGPTWERVEKQIPTLKAALEQDFRELLGVDDATA